MSFRWISLPRRRPSSRHPIGEASQRSKQIRRRMVLEPLESRELLSITLSSTNWTAVGPAPILNGETPGNQAVTGRITGVAADPADPSTLYVATSGGGVWKTTNGGTNWLPLTDTKSTLVIGAIALAPSNPQVIYAGTGEANNSPDSYAGRGVLKSIDGGANWTLLGTAQFNRRTIDKIAVSPTNPNLVFAAVSNMGTNGLPGNSGIWRSTDGGQTWIDTTANISTTDQYTDVVFSTADPTILYMAIGTPGGSANNGIYKSLNGGTSWQLLGGNLPAGSLIGRATIAISNPTLANPQPVIYASFVGTGATGSTPAGSLFKIFKSVDGTTFTDTTNMAPNYLGSQGNYDTTLAVDPKNSQVVYAGGAAGAGSFIESINGGTTWNAIDNTGKTNGPHGDHHAIGFDASGRLLDGNDGGLWRLDVSTPANPTWTDLNGNLEITQFNGIALNPANADVAYGGSQGTGTDKFTGSLVWTEVDRGNGGIVRVDQTNPNTVYHEFDRSVGAAPAGNADTFFQRSADAGASWINKSAGIATSDPSITYPPFVIDPSNSSRLLLGTNRVYETTSKGDAWTPISTPNANGWIGSAPITAIAVAQSNPSTIYAASGGHIFVTINDGASWTANDIPGITSTISDILVDPSSSMTAYAVVGAFNDSGPSGGHVFKTTSGGTSWADISGDLPNLPTYAIALDNRPGVGNLFIGTENGVFASSNQGQNWAPFAPGLPNVQVTSLELNTSLNILAAGTRGRGLFEIVATTSVIVQPIAPVAPVEGQSFTGPVATFTDASDTDPIANYSATINWGDGTSSTGSAVTITPGPGNAFTVSSSHTFKEEGLQTVTVSITEADGGGGLSNTTFTVGDAPLTQPAVPITITPTEGQIFTGPIATFSDTNPGATVADFTSVTITFGDGTTSLGKVTSLGGGKFQVSGTTTYQEEGTHDTSVTVTDVGGSTITIAGTAQIADAALTPVVPARIILATEGSTFSGIVGSFVDADPQGMVSDYTATINWGDGTPSSQGLVTIAGGGKFNVSGSHPFGEESPTGQSFAISITVSDKGGSVTNPPIMSKAKVVDAAITGAPATVNAVEGQPVTDVVVATFSDVFKDAPITDYSATINWGDQSPLDKSATIDSLNGKLVVKGSHTYKEAGTFIVNVTISDKGGAVTSPPIASTAIVTDATLSAVGLPVVSVIEGQSLPNNTVLASFTDSDPNATPADFKVSIDWGDGTPVDNVSGKAIPDPNNPGQFLATGSHAFPRAATYPVVVTIMDNDSGLDGNSATANTSVAVTDATLNPSGIAVQATEGVPFGGVVGTFTDTNNLAVPTDFLGTIFWGDGNSSNATIEAIPGKPGSFNVIGSNTYQEESPPGAPYQISVKINDLGGSITTILSNATVGDQPLMGSQGVTVNATEGQAFSGVVAGFNDFLGAQSTDFNTTINWGDGSPPTPGTITATGTGGFFVSGAHTYAEEKSYSIKVLIGDIGGAKGTATSTAIVGDAPLTNASLNPNVNLTRGVPFAGILAAFSDTNPGSTAADFKASINWGDGSPTEPGAVTFSRGFYTVTEKPGPGAPRHVYKNRGQFPVVVTITDDGGSQIQARGVATVLVALTGSLSPASDTGISNRDGITRDRQPVYTGTAEPGTIIAIFVQPPPNKPGPPIQIGKTTTPSSGTWSIKTSPLADGRYNVSLGEFSAKGPLLASIPLGTLIIDNTGPTVASTALVPGSGQAVINLKEDLAGLSLASLTNTANFTLAQITPQGTLVPISTTAVSVSPGGQGGLKQTVVVTFNHGTRLLAGSYVLTIRAAGVIDVAGNVLDERHFLTFPLTGAQPGNDYVAQFNVSKGGVAVGPIQYVPLSEQQAAAALAAYLRAHTKVRPPV